MNPVNNQDQTWIEYLSTENFPGRLQSCVVAFLPVGGVLLGLFLILDRFTALPWPILMPTGVGAYVAGGTAFLLLAISPTVIGPRVRLLAWLALIAVVLTCMISTIVYLVGS